MTGITGGQFLAVFNGVDPEGARELSLEIAGGVDAVHLIDAVGSLAPPSPGNVWSWAGWIRPATVSPTRQTIASFYEPTTPTGWLIELAGNQLQVLAYDAGSSTLSRVSTLTLSAAVWSFVAVTWDGATLTLWHGDTVAGTLTSEAYAESGAVTYSGAKYRLGGQGDAALTDFVGGLSETGFWDSEALGSGTITDLWNDGLGLQYPDLELVGVVTPAVYHGLQDAAGGAVDEVGAIDLAEAGGGDAIVYEANGPAAPARETGARALAIDFPGGSNGKYLKASSAPPAPSSPKVVSLDAWVYTHGLAGTQQVVGRGTGGVGFYFRIRNTGTIQVLANGSAVTTSGTISAVTWTYICAAWDGSNVTVKFGAYGGSLTTEVLPFTASVTHTGQTMILGGDKTLSNYKLNGRVAEVGYWDSALSAGAVTTRFASGLGTRYSELSASFKSTNGLLAYYGCQDSGGGAVDEHGTYDCDTEQGTAGDIAYGLTGPQ